MDFWELLILLWFPFTRGRCIFDQIHTSIKVVTPPAPQSNSPQWLSSEKTYPQRSRRDAEHFPHHQPIRIKTWIPTESSILSEPENQRLMRAVNDAVTKVSNLLSVRQVAGKLLLNRDMNKYCKFVWKNSSTMNSFRCARAKQNYESERCLGVIIPDQHLKGFGVYPHPDRPIRTELRSDGEGVQYTDFLLYVLARSTDKCRAEPSVLAYAAHCQADSEGRPLAGTLVFCRDHLTQQRYTHQHFVQTVIHELFHVLGFSKELFRQWSDCSLSYTGVECSSYGQVTSTDEVGLSRLYSPAVMRALKTHLSSSLETGAPLENKDAGSDGLSSHWEARVFQGSIMAAQLVEPSLVRIDPITLAALRDTGWYSVNLSRAQSLVWGDGEGSEFGSLSTCHNSTAFFCKGSGLGCHYLHLHKGQCLSDPYLDGCHIFKPLSNNSECWKEDNERNDVETRNREIYGSDSRCFVSNLTRENQSFADVELAGQCYRHRCVGMNRYQVQLAESDWLDCPAGKNIEVSGYQGLIFCPDKRLCKYPDVAPPAEERIAARHEVDDATLPHRLVHRYDVIAAAALSVIAAFSAVAAGLLAYRKCLSVGVQVHAAAESPNTPQGTCG